MSGGLLETIVAAARRSADERHRSRGAAVEREAARRVPRGAVFAAALAAPGVRIIAECKRRSPSRGVLRAAYDPPALARAYEQAGAAALSVLTEPTFFDGEIDHLTAVREATTLPVLRKDFLVTPFQLLESRAAGADAVLLIASALDDASLRAMREQAEALGLAALVEAHDREEVARATGSGARIIGVNCRNLRTLEVAPERLEQLAGAFPDVVIRVAESGLRSGTEVRRLRSLGYHAFLIGERFMADADPGGALAALIAESLGEKRA